MDERRIVTVLFCDVAGSTALAGQLDPEDWAEIIRAAFPCLIEPIERYGGTVARLLGDAVLAFFGAPVAHEDDAQRAILAGLGILQQIELFREQTLRDYGLDFNVRVGINTGTVIVGDFGAQPAFEYTAMGDAVNIAARMQQTAETGTVQVAAATYRLAYPHFTFESLGHILVKGKDDPIESYRVIGLAPETARRRRADFGAPTVGREREIAILRESLARLRDGQGGVIALVGEAGLGKSRLLEELRVEWARGSSQQPPSSWIEDRFASFEASVPYTLFRKRISDRLGTTDSDSPDTIRAQVVQHFGPSAADARERTLRAVDLLFHHSADRGAQPTTTEPAIIEDFRHELASLVEQLLRGWIQESGPAVYVIDDLHFVDPASLELLGTLLPKLFDLPLLVVLALRPDPQNAAWSLHRRLADGFPERYRAVTLAPLDEQQAGELVDALMTGASQSAAFRRSVLDRIDGNPLFAEEIVKSLIEQGLIVQLSPGDDPAWRIAANVDLAAVAVPNTLQVLIQERMDRLRPGAREVLQVAAVIGRSFGLRELAAVLDDPPSLEADIDSLQQAMLIRVSPQDVGREYSFNHALTWEAAYGTILRRRRRDLHLRVGEAFEALYANRTGEHAGLLGYHFAAAGDPRSIAYATRAGDRALAIYAPSEAIEHYSRVIDVAERLKLSVPVDVLRRRGQAYETLGQFDDARADVERALETAERARSLSDSWQAHMQLGLLWAGRDYTRSAAHYDRALSIAQQMDDPLLVAHSLNREGNLKVNAGEPVEARDYHHEALRIFRDAGDVPGMAQTYDLLGMAGFHSNDLVSSTENYEHAVKLQRDIDDRLGLASSLAMLSAQGGELDIDNLDRGLGEIEAGRRAGEEAISVSREIGWRSGESFALYMVGKAAGTRGEYAKAFELGRMSLAIAEDIEHHQWMTAGHCLLGNLYLDLLSTLDAHRYLEPALKLAGKLGSIWWLQRTASLLGSTLAAEGDLDHARAILDAAHPADAPAKTLGQLLVACAFIELALASDDPMEAEALVARVDCPDGIRSPRFVALRAQTLAALGRHDEAESAFGPLIERLKVKRLRPLLWRVEAQFGALLQETGRGPEAAARFEAARETIDEIASSIPDEALRDHFLAQAGGRLHGRPATMTS